LLNFIGVLSRVPIKSIGVLVAIDRRRDSPLKFVHLPIEFACELKLIIGHIAALPDTKSHNEGRISCETILQQHTTLRIPFLSNLSLTQMVAVSKQTDSGVTACLTLLLENFKLDRDCVVTFQVQRFIQFGTDDILAMGVGRIQAVKAVIIVFVAF